MRGYQKVQPMTISAERTSVQIGCDHIFEGISIRDGLACVVSDYYKKKLSELNFNIFGDGLIFTATTYVQKYWPIGLLAYPEQVLISEKMRYLEPGFANFSTPVSSLTFKYSHYKVEATDARVGVNLF